MRNIYTTRRTTVWSVSKCSHLRYWQPKKSRPTSIVYQRAYHHSVFRMVWYTHYQYINISQGTTFTHYGLVEHFGVMKLCLRRFLDNVTNSLPILTWSRVQSLMEQTLVKCSSHFFPANAFESTVDQMSATAFRPKFINLLFFLGRMTNICVSKLGHYRFKYWLTTCKMLSYYLN